MSYKKEALDFLGITRWHELGYTGKGIKIMSDEKVSQKKHPDVISPKGYKSTSGHGDDAMSHLKLVAPDATFIAYPMSVNSDGKGGYISPCADYIKNQEITIFTTSSTSGDITKYKEEAMQYCIDEGCIFFAAGGNDNKKGMRGEVRSEKYLAIGGVKPTYVNGSWDFTKLKKVSYSSIGEELDYVAIAEILSVSGTSFCAPVFAAMCGLVQQFFIEKVGRRLTRDEMAKFIADNLLDTEAEGFDTRTGHGLFRLPEPSSIDVNKYVTDIIVGDYIDYGGFPEVRSDVVMRAELKIDNKNVVINGKNHTYDTAPFIKDNRTFVPVRFLEDMGFIVEWIAEEMKVVIINKV